MAKSIRNFFIDADADQADEIKQAVEKEGAVILRKIISTERANNLKVALLKALDEDNKKYGDDYLFNGMVHALMSRGIEFIELLEQPEILAIFRAILGHGCIVHAYNSSSMPPNKTNFSRSIHVDCPRLIPGYITNLGINIAIDPFTNENGAMEIFPDSFTMASAPGEELFNKEKIILNDLQAGDAILFNARCWHRGGVNTTTQWRHSISANICRAYMRQQFDYPAMLGDSKIQTFSDDIKQLIGYNVRMPANMEEFLLPADKRKYKAGQE